MKSVKEGFEPEEFKCNFSDWAPPGEPMSPEGEMRRMAFARAASKKDVAMSEATKAYLAAEQQKRAEKLKPKTAGQLAAKLVVQDKAAAGAAREAAMRRKVEEYTEMGVKSYDQAVPGANAEK